MKPGDERGFIHKKILGVAKKALGVGSSLLPGVNIARQAVGAIGTGVTLLRGGGPRVNVSTLPRGSRFQVPTPGIAGRIQRFLPGGATGFTTIPEGLRPKGPGGILGAFPGVPGGVTGFASPEEGTGVCPPRGFHLNKSSYFLRDGTFVQRGTKFVRNRKRNASNGRANDKAIGRLDGAQTQAKKVLKATGWRTISKQSGREIRSAKKATCK